MSPTSYASRSPAPAALTLLAALALGCGAPAPPSEPVAPPLPALGPPEVIHFSAARPLRDTPTAGYSGVALADFNGDTHLDIALAGATGVRLYTGDGAGNFTPTQGPAGPQRAAAVVFADVDADLDLDLIITTRQGPDHLWQNDGAGHFQDTPDAGLDTPTFGEGATLGDLDGDGDLDLYICQGAQGDGGGELGTRGRPNVAYQNDGAGHFQDHTQAWGIGGLEHGESFMGLLVDLDEDGDLDLFVVHDAFRDQVFLNPGKDTAWTDATALYSPDDPTSIMGLDIGDFDGDGHLDLYATTASSDRLYTRAPAGGLANRYLEAIGQGLDQSVVQVGYGVALVDFDHDTDLDVLTVSSFADGSEAQSAYAGPGALVLLTQSPGAASNLGTLTDTGDQAGPAFERSLDGWGLAVGDVDHDTDLDVVIAASNGFVGQKLPDGDTPHPAPFVLLNTSRPAHDRGALRLILRAPNTPNPYAVGALVTLEQDALTAARPVMAGNSYLSQSDMAVHFGLGDFPRAGVVTVRWPDGLIQRWLGLEPGEHVLTRDPAATCCLPDGCSGEDEAACRAHLGAVLGRQDACQEVCQRLQDCHALSGAGFADQAQCITQCGTQPPSNQDLQCVLFAPCATISACFEE